MWIWWNHEREDYAIFEAVYETSIYMKVSEKLRLLEYLFGCKTNCEVKRLKLET